MRKIIAKLIVELGLDGVKVNYHAISQANLLVSYYQDTQTPPDRLLYYIPLGGPLSWNAQSCIC